MQEHEDKLREGMEQAGWKNVRVLPPAGRLYGDAGIEAMGDDDTGDLTVHIDASPRGQIEGFELYRQGLRPGESEASGRIPYPRGIPSPEQAAGVWEDLAADEARRGLR